jgi:hypothetical protein
MLEGVRHRVERARADRLISRQVEQVEQHLSLTPEARGKPVFIFNASTRIQALSLNAAFSLLASWGLRARGIPVKYLVCHWGMQQCMLGADAEAPSQPPPCRQCTRFSGLLFPAALTFPLRADQELIENLAQDLDNLSLEELETWEHDGLPLGKLCLPTVRWALRRHNLQDDSATHQLFRMYLLSAASLAGAFEKLIDEQEPRALVVFNGITYPEAIARTLAVRRGLPVITHEVGLRPLSAFFSSKHATFREVDVPEEGELESGWRSKLNGYLDDRRDGRFSMAGVQFWPQMEPLPEWLQNRMIWYRQSVSVFTNVVFDTSQIHANTVFPHMFEWLNALREVILERPETLFVIRAHPDEDRPGKASQESVANWYEASGLKDQENVAFLSPSESVSSYELIEHAKFVLVYNSSIGLEAAIQGKLVLCAGRARYTHADTVFFPSDRAGYMRELNKFLEADTIAVPSEYAERGRRFLYRELFQASLDLSDFLQPYPTLPGMAYFTDFEPSQLDGHPSLEAIRRGILMGDSFLSTETKLVPRM